MNEIIESSNLHIPKIHQLNGNKSLKKNDVGLGGCQNDFLFKTHKMLEGG